MKVYKKILSILLLVVLSFNTVIALEARSAKIEYIGKDVYKRQTKCFSYKIKKELPQNFKIIPFSSFSKIKVKK